MKKRPRVLADHKKVGKTFIPPLVAELGPMSEVRWVTDLVPELVWLALLSKAYGLRAGAELARRLAFAAINTRGESPKEWFALASAYARLDTSEQQAVVIKLEQDRVAQEIREALSPLMFYPECPLGFLFADSRKPTNVSLKHFKRVLASIFDKNESPGTFTQATAVHIAFLSDMLRVFKGLALANFSAIEDFPDTGESQRVANSIRLAALVLYQTFAPESSRNWISYFWNRGLELEKCRFDSDAQ